MIKKNKKISGFTLAELMVTTVIIVLAFLGMLIGFLKCLELHELSRNSSIAVAAVKTQIENIKNTDPADLIATYHNATFISEGLTGMGVSYVTNTDPEVFEVTVSFCWRQKNGRVIGEDENLNGQLNGGEDLDADGIIDSPVQVVTYIHNG